MPRRKQIYVTAMTSQVIVPEMAVRLTRNKKTFSAEELRPRNARQPKDHEKRTEMYGTPVRLVVLKMRGAWPCVARECSVREVRKTSELAAESAEVRMAALMMEGKTLIPAAWMAMT